MCYEFWGEDERLSEDEARAKKEMEQLLRKPGQTPPAPATEPEPERADEHQPVPA